MKRKPVFILGAFAATTLVSNAAVVWQAGSDDGTHITNGVAGGPGASFLQENGAINALPGNFISSSSANAGGTPTPPPGQERPDNDYYFAGNYSTVLPGNGSYSPVGIVATDELAAERAHAAGDLDLRYHFNLPVTMSPNDLLSFTYEPLNLDDLNATNFDPRFGNEVYFNGVLVMPEVITRPGDLNIPVTTAQFTLASVGAVTGPGADNIVSLRGISYNGGGVGQGGGNWMGVDYVRLDVEPIPEPGTSTMVLVGAIGCTAFFGRRRPRK